MSSRPRRKLIVESAFGSQPICMTVYPCPASAADMLETVVDLPIPPLPYIAILFIEITSLLNIIISQKLIASCYYLL